MKQILSFVASVLIVAMVTPALAQTQTPLETLKRLRQQYPITNMSREQAAELLNRTAWEHRTDGLALLGKRGGNNCPTAQGVLVSCDFLVYATTRLGYDVLVAWDEAGTPAWQGPEDLTAAITNGDRTIVLPVDPGLPGSPPVVTPPPPVVTPPPVGPPPVTPPPAVDPVGLAEVKTIAQQARDLAAEAVLEIKAHRAGVQNVWLKVSAIAGPILTAVLTWLKLRGGGDVV